MQSKPIVLDAKLSTDPESTGTLLTVAWEAGIFAVSLLPIYADADRESETDGTVLAHMSPAQLSAIGRELQKLADMVDWPDSPDAN